MGLRLGRFVTAAFICFSFAALVNAAPKLRLVTSTVGLVPVAAGTAGTSQTVEAYNAEDGSLSLSVSASASWLAASVGSPRACAATTSSSTCIPLQFALNTSALAAGTYTGIVTVSASNALDAPQTVTVTVRIDGVDVYVAPGSSRDIPFTASKPLTWSATTQGRRFPAPSR